METSRPASTLGIVQLDKELFVLQIPILTGFETNLNVDALRDCGAGRIVAEISEASPSRSSDVDCKWKDFSRSGTCRSRSYLFSRECPR